MGVRQNAQALPESDVATLRQAFTAVLNLADDRGYQHWAGIHGLPLPMYCQHGTILFLPWHRAYLYMFERALQDQVSGVTLPWWDWTSSDAHANGVPGPYRSTTDSAGAPNPLYDAPVTTLAQSDVQQLVQNGALTAEQSPRTLRDSEQPDELPRAATISAILNAPTFQDFTQQMENVHNDVHGWVGGSMGIIPVSAYDPIFWAHHCMIDRLWYLWQLQQPTATVPAAILTRALPPFPLTVTDTLDIARLGYSYGSQVVG